MAETCDADTPLAAFFGVTPLRPPQINALYVFDTATGNVDSLALRSTPEPTACFATMGLAGPLPDRR